MIPEIEEELRNAKLPLWLAFPDMPRYSVGWRMGEGDTYSWDFSEWWDTLSPVVQQEYQMRYPEPVGWRGWYCEEDWDEEGDESEGINNCEADVC